MKRAAGVRELMDEPLEPSAELDGNLRDIAFANRWLGGIGPIRREVRRSGARTLLDVGSGAADIPLALARDARARRTELAITCLDHAPAMLEVARRRSGDDGRLTFVHADGARLPFEDRSFDVVTCTLALHHFEPPAARALLGELRRVARVTPIVGDLVRSRIAYLGTWLWATLTSRNRLTRHDAPLSVRRAYTRAEALDLARAAGWQAPRAIAEPFFRMTLVDG